MNWLGGIKTASGIAWFSLGAIVGWPFAGALILPFALEEGLLLAVSLGAGKDQFVPGALRVLKGIVVAIGILVSATTA